MKTKISVKKIMKLNKWIKTKAQAEKIIYDINSKPSFSLSDLLRADNKGGL